MDKFAEGRVEDKAGFARPVFSSGLRRSPILFYGYLDPFLNAASCAHLFTGFVIKILFS